MKATPGVMRIGEVHAQLRKIFPSIELSKIRYYEDKGLVQPSRSRKGYRLYSERDVECLREAIRLAQEEFVPLRVVRLRLIEQGLLDADADVESASRRARGGCGTSSVVPAPPDAQRANAAGLDRGRVIRRVTTSHPHGSRSISRTPKFSRRPVCRPRRSISSTRSVCWRRCSERRSPSPRSTCASPPLARAARARPGPRLLGSLRRVAEREIGLVDDLTQPLRSRAASTRPNRCATSRRNWRARSARCAAFCTSARCRTTSVARRRISTVRGLGCFMVEVVLRAVRVDVGSSTPLLLLEEVAGARVLPIFIGAPEAAAIAYALQGVEAPRPMSHDLLGNVIVALGAQLFSAEITGTADNTFYANLRLLRSGDEINVSARPSDAVALALRVGAPILVNDDLMAAEGRVMELDLRR